MWKYYEYRFGIVVYHSWIYDHYFNVLAYLFMDYDDVMLTLSGLPPAFPYGRVDGVQDA